MSDFNSRNEAALKDYYVNTVNAIAMETLDDEISRLEARCDKQLRRIKSLDRRYQALSNRIVGTCNTYYDTNPLPETMNITWRHAFLKSEEHKVINILELRSYDIKNKLNAMTETYTVYNSNLTQLVNLRHIIEAKLKR